MGALVSRLRDGLAVIGRQRTLAEVLVLTGMAWGATVLAYAAAGQAVGLQLTLGQASLLASGVALAAAIPAGPASLGTFELASVRIGGTLGIAPEPAFALAILVHAGILLLTSGGGIVALVRLGWRRETSPAAIGVDSDDRPTADSARPRIAD